MVSQSLILTDHQKNMLKISLDWKFSKDFPRFVLYNKTGELYEPLIGNVPVSYLHSELNEAFLKNPDAELGVLLGGAPWQTLCVDPCGEEQLKKIVSPDFFSSIFYYKKYTKEERELVQSYYFIENVNSKFLQSLELFPGCRIMGFNETLPFAFSFFNDFYISTEKGKKVLSFPPELLKLKNEVEKKSLKTIFSLDEETGIDIIKTPLKVVFESEEDKKSISEEEARILKLAEIFFGDDSEGKDIVVEEKCDKQIPNPLYISSPLDLLSENQIIEEKSLDNGENTEIKFQKIFSELAENAKQEGERLPEPELDKALTEKFLKKPSLPPMVYPENPCIQIDTSALMVKNLWEKLFFFTLLNGLSFQKIVQEKFEIALTPAEVSRHTGLRKENLYNEMSIFGHLYPDQAKEMLHLISSASREGEETDASLDKILLICRSSLLAGINSPEKPKKIKTSGRKSLRIL